MKGYGRVKEPIIAPQCPQYRCARAKGKPGALDGDGKHLLRTVLPYHVLVEEGLDIDGLVGILDPPGSAFRR